MSSHVWKHTSAFLVVLGLLIGVLLASFNAVQARQPALASSPIQPASTPTPAWECTVKTMLNLRGGPGRAFPITGKLPPTTQIRRVAASPDGQWLRVAEMGDNPRVGWVDSNFLECDVQPSQLPIGEVPEILSFTAVPGRIQAGETATLQWRTENADFVYLGLANPEFPLSSPNPIVRLGRINMVTPSGRLLVEPSQTTEYSLVVLRFTSTGIKRIAQQSVLVEMVSCSISGRVLGQLTWSGSTRESGRFSVTATNMTLWAPGKSQSVTVPIQGGTYLFTDVPAGRTYTINPTDRSGSVFRSTPESVLCRPNERHNLDITITGGPAFD